MRWILFIILFLANSLYSQEYLNTFLTAFYSATLNERNITINDLKNMQKILFDSDLTTEQKLITQFYTTDALARFAKESTKNYSQEIISEFDNLYEVVEKNPNKSAEFLTMKADLRAQVMMTKSLSQLISMSKQNLKDYKESLAKDKSYFPAYLGLAQWYYFAPKIGGGNVGTTLRYLEEGSNYATSDLQKFQYLVWKSQALFRQNKKDESQKLLTEALLIFPKSKWALDIQAENTKGRFFK